MRQSASKRKTRDRLTKGGIFVGFAIGLLLLVFIPPTAMSEEAAGGTAASQGAMTVPGIYDLEWNIDPETGEIGLIWDTPEFELGDTEVEQWGYEIRLSDEYIGDTNWGMAPIYQGNTPDLAANINTGVDLITNYYTDDTGTVYHDKLYLNAIVGIPFNGPIGGTLYRNLLGETIDFTIYKGTTNSGSVKDSGQDTTSRPYGEAEFYSKDLTDLTQAESQGGVQHHCEAVYSGRTIGFSNGVLQVSLSSSYDYDNKLVWEGTTSQSGYSWSRLGGRYTNDLLDVEYTFDVPDGAVVSDVDYEISSPTIIPSPDGMNPGVPGAMTAFELSLDGGATINEPVRVHMTYPEFMLWSYGALGESSLRPYVYNEASQVWERIDGSSFDREENTISFLIEGTGLFALGAETDMDLDGLGDMEEIYLDTNPMEFDTDGDGLGDGDEICLTLSDPLHPWKVDSDDQFCMLNELEFTEGCYVAMKIVGPDGLESPVSNCVYIPSLGATTI